MNSGRTQQREAGRPSHPGADQRIDEGTSQPPGWYVLFVRWPETIWKHNFEAFRTGLFAITYIVCACCIDIIFKVQMDYNQPVYY